MHQRLGWMRPSISFVMHSAIIQKNIDEMIDACFQGHALTRMSRRIEVPPELPEPPEPPWAAIKERLLILESEENKKPNPDNERRCLTVLSYENRIDHCKSNWTSLL